VASITSIRAGGGRNRAVAILLDSGEALELALDVVVEKGLRVGQPLPRAAVKDLLEADRVHRCYAAAIRFLSYRPRSESEVRLKLRQRRFDGETVEKTVARLKQQGLLDDDAFAHFWKESRQSFHPRSGRLITHELRQKGVSPEIAQVVADEVDEEEAAYRAAQKRAPRLLVLDYGDFQRRLGGYLRRRGFSYGITKKTVDRLWREGGRALE
jgi:regulatory protein